LAREGDLERVRNEVESMFDLRRGTTEPEDLTDDAAALFGLG